MTPRETTVAASVVADMLQYLARRGVRTEVALRAAGIGAGFPASPDDRVPGSRVERLWSFAVDQTGDPLVGLHMAESYNPGALDILGYVILSCRNVGEALEKFARYARLLNDGMRVELVREGKTAFCRITYVDGMDNYLLRSPQHAIDATWGGLAREMRRLAGTPLGATAVWFRHAAPNPASVAEYNRVLGAAVRFGAAEDRFIFPSTHLDQPLPSANPMLLEVFEQHARAALPAIAAEPSCADQVARVLSQKLKGSAPALEEIARELSMSSRNLQRTLRGAGTSYQLLLDAARRDLAIRHLANPATSAGQVGFLLGFSEPSAFHRAFRRWTGKSPSAFRPAQSG
jgi:AraC-like DNA-binding protein